MEREEFEREVVARARRFDLVALLHLLSVRGYTREQIMLRSKTKLASARSLVESIEFAPDSQQVIITVNIGLLGGQGLLPSYFDTALRDSQQPRRMLEFLRFFDHRLLEAFARVLSPERDLQLFPRLADTRRSLFQMSGVASQSTLHWLFRSVFPELTVHVQRHALPQRSEAFGAEVGEALLDGTSIVGKSYETLSDGMAVQLCAADEHHDHGERWFDLVRERMRGTVLPLLSPFRFALLVELAIPHRAAAALEPETPAWFYEPAQLGYGRVLGEEPGGGLWPAPEEPLRSQHAQWQEKVGGHQVVEIFRGNTGDTDAEEQLREVDARARELTLGHARLRDTLGSSYRARNGEI